MAKRTSVINRVAQQAFIKSLNSDFPEMAEMLNRAVFVRYESFIREAEAEYRDNGSLRLELNLRSDVYDCPLLYRAFEVWRKLFLRNHQSGWLVDLARKTIADWCHAPERKLSVPQFSIDIKTVSLPIWLPEHATRAQYRARAEAAFQKQLGQYLDWTEATYGGRQKKNTNEQARLAALRFRGLAWPEIAKQVYGLNSRNSSTRARIAADRFASNVGIVLPNADTHLVEWLSAI